MDTKPDTDINTDAHDWAQGAPEGWYSLVLPVVKDLMALGCNILQVKEKFGGLRLYYSAPMENEENCVTTIKERACYQYSRELVDNLEWACWRTCQRCGTTKGVDRNNQEDDYWISTLCGTCREERNAKRA